MKRLSKKQKKQIFFIFFPILFILLMFVSVFYFAPFKVSRSWLTIEFGEFQDTKNDGSKPLITSIGGYDLLSFVESDSDLIAPDTVVYYGEATFGWELLVYSNLLMEDVFNDLDRNHLTYRKFLHYTEHDWLNNLKTYNADKYANYRDVYYSGISPHHYDGNLPINLSLNDDISGLVGQTIAGAEIQGVEMLYQFTETRRVQYDRGVVGDYDDDFTSLTPLDPITVSSYTIGKDNLNDVADPDNYINALSIGVTPLTEGAWLVDYSEVSDSPEFTDHYSTAGEVKVVIPINLRPRIEHREQNINVRYGTVRVYRDFWNTMWFTDTVNTRLNSNINYPRVTAVKCTNQWIKQEFETKVTMVATVQYDHELSQTELSDPQFFQGDQVWDIGLGGSGDVTILNTQSGWDVFWEGVMDGANQIFFVIILVAVIYAMIKIVPRLIPRRKQRIVIQSGREVGL